MTRPYLLLVWSLLVVATSSVVRAEEVKPLRNAHAHNDYEHERPLFDALDHGFTSVEADIHLVDGKLLVAHDAEDVHADRTLEALYLAPLQVRVRENNGSVYSTPCEFILLVDIKTEAEATYQALSATLAKYPDLCTRWTAEGRVERPVTIIVSGNRPIETIARQSPRLAAVDGRLADLETEVDPELMPLISDRWDQHFSWQGEGEMPAEEREKLQSIVGKAHGRKQKLRFWGTPERGSAWGELSTARVDLLGTDDLAGLSAFLTSTQSE